MASQWHSLVSQKLFLARTLLGQADHQPSASAVTPDDPARAVRREASVQGAIELMLRARQLTLVMIARLYQKKAEQPVTLDDLARLVGPDASEVDGLRALARQPGSWWGHLDQLATAQSQPPAQRKTISAENIIAVSAESGPDRSTPALLATCAAIKQFVDHLEDQHSEW